MKLKNSDNNTKVFNRPCVGTQNALTDFLLAQKKMAELKPPSLVVMNHNAAINPQDQTEVPRPCHAFSIFCFQITERCPMKITRFFGPTTYSSCAFRGDTVRYKDVTNRPVAAPTFTINRHNTWHRQHAC